MTKPFLLVQLSDPHIGATWAGGDPAAGLKAAVESVRRLPDVPDAVLMSGNLADHAADAEYEFVRESLEQLGAPVYVLPGNHDDGTSTFPEPWGRRCSTRRISGRCGLWCWTARDLERIGASWTRNG